jgi:transglutaminase-like putative cysteine protease
MTVMARTLGLPARVAVGYAPGDRVRVGVYEVREKNAHAWAEIYFPGYGWQIFEATKSIAPVDRAAGAGVVPPVQPPPSGSDAGKNAFEGKDLGEVSTLPSFEPVPEGFQAGGQKPSDDARSGNAWVFVALLVLLLAIVAWRLLRARRRLRFLAPGDRQWQRLTLAADRAGVAQRPQTVYEYAAGWLEEQIPPAAARSVRSRTARSGRATPATLSRPT